MTSTHAMKGFSSIFFGIWNEPGNTNAIVHHKANGQNHKEWHVASECIAMHCVRENRQERLWFSELFALQECQTGHVLFKGFDPKAVGAFAVQSFLADGRAHLLLPPVLRSQATAF